MSRESFLILPDGSIEHARELSQLSHQLMQTYSENLATMRAQAEHFLGRAGEGVGAAPAPEWFAAASGQEQVNRVVVSASGQGFTFAPASGQGHFDTARRQLELRQAWAQHQRASLHRLFVWQRPQRNMVQEDVLWARNELRRAYERYNSALRDYTDLLLGFSLQLAELMQLHADLQVYLLSGRWTRTLAASMRVQIDNSEPPLEHLQTLRGLLQHL